LSPKLNDTPIALGAQTCSPHASGAYTGQVAASTLAEVGCTYCLIGHSERRACGETNEQIVGQYNQLVNNNLTPIVCIGESTKDYAAGNTMTILEQQLLPLVKTYQENPSSTFLIAYEPVWAIGTGKIPTSAELTTIFAWLKKRLQNDLPEATTFFLYGGSVDETNSAAIKNITHLDGLLVGSASLNFKNFKNIVV
jgi:triosephosphate isomerase